MKHAKRKIREIVKNTETYEEALEAKLQYARLGNRHRTAVSARQAASGAKDEAVKVCKSCARLFLKSGLQVTGEGVRVQPRILSAPAPRCVTVPGTQTALTLSSYKPECHRNFAPPRPAPTSPPRCAAQKERRACCGPS